MASPFRVLPGVKVVKIGGQSIIDRGMSGLGRLLAEILIAHEEGIQVLICTGGGTRARSIYSLASDLRLPTGMLADVGARVPVQNARIIQTLLAEHGGIVIEPDDFGKLPMFFRSGCIPIMGGMPPYSYWEMRDPGSRIPPNRTDAGTFLTAEYVGCDRAIYVKDEDGLFSGDPKGSEHVYHIPRITAHDLTALDLGDVVVERSVIEYLPRAVWCRELHIVNGLKYGHTLTALRGGETCGSIIRAD